MSGGLVVVVVVVVVGGASVVVVVVEVVVGGASVVAGGASVVVGSATTRRRWRSSRRERGSLRCRRRSDGVGHRHFGCGVRKAAPAPMNATMPIPTSATFMTLAIMARRTTVANGTGAAAVARALLNGCRCGTGSGVERIHAVTSSVKAEPFAEPGTALEQGEPSPCSRRIRESQRCRPRTGPPGSRGRLLATVASAMP